MNTHNTFQSMMIMLVLFGILALAPVTRAQETSADSDSSSTNSQQEYDLRFAESVFLNKVKKLNKYGTDLEESYSQLTNRNSRLRNRILRHLSKASDPEVSRETKIGHVIAAIDAYLEADSRKQARKISGAYEKIQKQYGQMADAALEKMQGPVEGSDKEESGPVSPRQEKQKQAEHILSAETDASRNDREAFFAGFQEGYKGASKEMPDISMKEISGPDGMTGGKTPQGDGFWAGYYRDLKKQYRAIRFDHGKFLGRQKALQQARRELKMWRKRLAALLARARIREQTRSTREARERLQKKLGQAITSVKEALDQSSQANRRWSPVSQEKLERLANQNSKEEN